MEVLGQSTGQNPIFEEAPHAKVMRRCFPSCAFSMHPTCLQPKRTHPRDNTIGEQELSQIATVLDLACHERMLSPVKHLHIRWMPAMATGTDGRASFARSRMCPGLTAPLALAMRAAILHLSRQTAPLCRRPAVRTASRYGRVLSSCLSCV